MHPDRDHWSEHIRFQPSTDTNEPVRSESLSPVGKASIEVLDLIASQCATFGSRTNKLARADYVTALTALAAARNRTVLTDIQKRYESGLPPFHAAAKDEINSYAKSIDFPAVFP